MMSTPSIAGRPERSHALVRPILGRREGGINNNNTNNVLSLSLMPLLRFEVTLRLLP